MYSPTLQPRFVELSPPEIRVDLPMSQLTIDPARKASAVSSLAVAALSMFVCGLDDAFECSRISLRLRDGVLHVPASDVAHYLGVAEQTIWDKMSTPSRIAELSSLIRNRALLDVKLQGKPQKALLLKSFFRTCNVARWNLQHHEEMKDSSDTRYYRRGVLNNQEDGNPLGVEITPDNEIFVLFKGVKLDDDLSKRVCLAVRDRELGMYAFASVALNAAAQDGTTDPNELKKMVRSEFAFQSTLEGPFVKMYHISQYTNKTGDVSKLGVILQHSNRGDLLEHIITIGNGNARDHHSLYDICEDMVNALIVLNQKGIQHRNVRLEQFKLYEDDTQKIRARLGNFSFAVYVSDKEMGSSACHISTYISPEFARGHALIRKGREALDIDAFNSAPNEALVKQGEASIREGTELASNTKCDVWSLGVCLYEMLTGKSFFLVARKYAYGNELPHEELLDNIAAVTSQDIDDFFADIDIPENSVMHLVRRMLAYDPAQRPSPEECLENVKRLRSQGAPFEFRLQEDAIV